MTKSFAALPSLNTGATQSPTLPLPDIWISDTPPIIQSPTDPGCNAVGKIPHVWQLPSKGTHGRIPVGESSSLVISTVTADPAGSSSFEAFHTGTRKLLLATPLVTLAPMELYPLTTSRILFSNSALG